MSVPVNSVQSLVRPTDLRMRLGQLARFLFSFAGLAFYPESVRRGRKKRTIRVRGQCPANPRIDLSVASLRNVCASRVSTWRLSLSLRQEFYLRRQKSRRENRPRYDDDNDLAGGATRRNRLCRRDNDRSERTIRTRREESSCRVRCDV